jgi:A/G-specific adenine glycosylase
MVASSRRSISVMKASRFRRALRTWHRGHMREYPWRQRNPAAYRVLIAEILLRKTTATQAAGVYSAFLEAYPSVEALAAADPEALRKLLRPLGIADRGRLLKQLGLTLVSDYRGRIPGNVNALLKLPGVGRYTANAVLAFSHGRRVALVDANVIRVLGRIFGWLSPKKRPHLDDRLWQFAQSLLPRTGAREYHLALLDFAALTCRARAPLCTACPMAQWCQYALRLTPESAPPSQLKE